MKCVEGHLQIHSACQGVRRRMVPHGVAVVGSKPSTPKYQPNAELCIKNALGLLQHARLPQLEMSKVPAIRMSICAAKNIPGQPWKPYGPGLSPYGCIPAEGGVLGSGDSGGHPGVHGVFFPFDF